MFEKSFPQSARPTLRYIFPNSVDVARYDALIRAKSPTNCDAHLAESFFQTRSKSEKRKISFGDRSGCEQGEVCYRSRSKQ